MAIGMDESKLILCAILGSIFTNIIKAGIRIVPPPIPIPPITPAKKPIIVYIIKTPS